MNDRFVRCGGAHALESRFTRRRIENELRANVRPEENEERGVDLAKSRAKGKPVEVEQASCYRCRKKRQWDTRDGEGNSAKKPRG